MLANTELFETLYKYASWHNILQVLLKIVMMHKNDRQTLYIAGNKINALEVLAQISSVIK